MFKNKKAIFILVFTVCAIVALVILATSLFDEAPDGSDVVVDSGKIREEPFSVLILGKDEVSGLTDVMMLASFDAENDRICVMQIPRDTYAEYSDKHRKLNTASRVLGGERELCDFLSDALGVSIDGYVSLELEGFRRAVDAIGGVEIELDRTLYYNDPEQDLYIYLQKGKQLLDGKKAEMLVRYRSAYKRGDLDRLDMQKVFLRVLFTKIKASVNISNAYELASSVFPYMDTNIPLAAFISLGLKALDVEDSGLVFLTLPGEDAKGGDGGSYYVMSKEHTRRVLEEYFVSTCDEIDRKRLFEHPTNKDFQKIYHADVSGAE